MSPGVARTRILLPVWGSAHSTDRSPQPPPRPNIRYQPPGASPVPALPGKFIADGDPEKAKGKAVWVVSPAGLPSLSLWQPPLLGFRAERRSRGRRPEARDDQREQGSSGALGRVCGGARFTRVSVPAASGTLVVVEPRATLQDAMS
jgi:hypothetical protein